MTPLELRLTRQKRKMNQTQMAKLLQVSRATLNRWEMGHYAIDSDVTNKLENAGITIAVDDSAAIYAYRAARLVFKKDHERCMRMANVTLHEQGKASFSVDDMRQIAIEYPGIVSQEVRDQLIKERDAACAENDSSK